MKVVGQYKYQAVLVIDPKVNQPEVDSVLAQLGVWVKEAGGRVLDGSNWGVKELAYPIKKNTKGNFWIVPVGSDKPLSMSKISVSLNREPKIIRYLILNSTA